MINKEHFEGPVGDYCIAYQMLVIKSKHTLFKFLITLDVKHMVFKKYKLFYDDFDLFPITFTAICLNLRNVGYVVKVCFIYIV